MQETTAFWSGHANSSAMVLRMIEIGRGPDLIVHACTGLEFEPVIEYMERFERFIGQEIIYEDVTKEKPKYEFFTFFNSPWMKGSNLEGQIHGSPKMMNRCWHNRNVKQPVFNKYEKTSSEVYTGFTVNERHRVERPRLQAQRVYPLIQWQWSAADSLAYLRMRDIPHPMYEVYGFERLGCAICPKQGDNALYRIYKHFPEIWDQILDIEDRSPHGFRGPKEKTPYELMDEWENRNRPPVTLERWIGCAGGLQ